MKEYGRDRKWPFAEGGGVTILLATVGWGTAVFLARKLIHPLTQLLAWLTTAVWLLILYFFRDPQRDIASQPGLVLSPTDGEVVEIAHEAGNHYLHQPCIRISIFLSITNVHIQRVPIGGTVTQVTHRPGQFLQAFRPEASDVNEFIAMMVETEGYGRILVKQIAGILARRCVNYCQPGDQVTTGQRFGLIRFSSRVDLFLPPNAQLLLQVGDKVHAGLTPMAQLKQQET